MCSCAHFFPPLTLPLLYAWPRTTATIRGRQVWAKFGVEQNALDSRVHCTNSVQELLFFCLNESKHLFLVRALDGGLCQESVMLTNEKLSWWSDCVYVDLFQDSRGGTVKAVQGSKPKPRALIWSESGVDRLDVGFLSSCQLSGTWRDVAVNMHD